MSWIDLNGIEVSRLLLNRRPYLVGVSAVGDHRILACQEQDIVHPSRFCPVVTERLHDAATWGGFTDAGEIVGSPHYVNNPPPLRDWLLIGHDAYFVGLDSDHVVHLREDDPRGTNGEVDVVDLPFELRGEPVSVVGMLNDETYFACVLDSTGEVQCRSTEVLAPYMHFDHPPYRSLAYIDLFACAQRVVDDVVECSDGSERDFGVPLHHLTLAKRGATAPYYNNPDYVIPVCGISYDNRILCDHPTYFTPETLQALEDLP